MEMQVVTIKLPLEMRRELARMARSDDVSPGQLVRALINREISRRQNAKPPARADEQLVAPLRARLAGDLALSPSWTDLTRRLRAKGYDLREAGGGLALHAWPSGTRLCKASDLGFSYGKLMRRLRAPFPGHSHAHLVKRHLEDPEPPDESFELIERD